MDNDRLIVIITLGYVLGIIWGLYSKINIVLFYMLIIVIIMVIKSFKLTLLKKRIIKKQDKKRKFRFFSINKIFRYIKLIFNIKTIVIIILTSIISNVIITFSNNKYENLYSNLEEVELIGKIVDNGTEKEYKYVYKIKVETINGEDKYKNTNLYLNLNKNLDIKYGDKIKLEGKYIKPNISRNYKGFNYLEYLKTMKIYGTVQASRIMILQNDTNNIIFTYSNKIFLKIKDLIQTNMDTEKANLLLGILLGYKDGISENIKEDFSKSNISHILAISGLHISYIVLAITKFSEKIFGKKEAPKITIAFIIAYMFITNFSPSVTRAGIMAIMILLSRITHNKNDIWTSIAMSLLLILISNPYLIMNAGLLLSFAGTIGIIIFQKSINNFFQKLKSKIKIYKYNANKITVKIINYIQDTLSVSFSAQIVIIPIMIQLFNTFSMNFFITNFLVSIIIGPIIIIGFIFTILCFINMQLYSKNFILSILKILIEKLILILIEISKLGNIIPLSKINIITLPISSIILYYLIMLLGNLIYKISNKKSLSTFEKRIINWKNLIKHRIRKNKNKLIILITAIVIIMFIINLAPKNMQIHFIDVGQGDSTLIITPNNKTILIDGGGSEYYDIGKNTLLPYLLDMGISRLNYMVISHFDSDHVNGLLTILKELQVENIIIGKQYEKTQQYNQFLEIIYNNQLNIKQVSSGDRINVEKDVSIDILFPTKKLISTNPLNNNSIVAKLRYKQFDMLFTGDIEEIAENQLLDLYSNTNILKSTILKVAHHGSKTSSSEKFINIVSPKFAVIGVGENNKFGHPNQEVIKRLQNKKIKIYRTDLNGEITIVLNNKRTDKKHKYQNKLPKLVNTNRKSI